MTTKKETKEEKVLNMESKDVTIDDVLDHYEDNVSVQTVYQFFAGCKNPETNEIIHEFEIREMTGADEEQLQVNTKGNLVNPVRKLEKLLERCIVRIGNLTPKSVGIDTWRQIIRDLNVVDSDYALMMIRKIGSDDSLEVHTTCPNCDTKIKTTVEIDELETVPYSGSEDLTERFELTKGVYDKRTKKWIKSGTIRLSTNYDRELYLPLVQKNAGKGITLMLTRLVSFDGMDTVFEDEFRSMTSRDRKILTDLNHRMMKFGLQYTLDVECPNCSEKFMTSFEDIRVNF